MNNNLFTQLEARIKSLEIKLNKPKITLKSQIELLHELNRLKTLLNEFYKSKESKNNAIINNNITDITKQIDKANTKGKFMVDYTYNLEK